MLQPANTASNAKTVKRITNGGFPHMFLAFPRPTLGAKLANDLCMDPDPWICAAILTISIKRIAIRLGYKESVRHVQASPDPPLHLGSAFPAEPLFFG